ncbi:hypothetical protein, partial [Methanohalobium sp.]|uniref:hypothetical protein n=1 Tax=Methanohalobium sp. TaxID=2837493 RepID=UPI0025F1C9F0
MEKGSVDISGIGKINNAKTTDTMLVLRRTGNGWKWRRIPFKDFSVESGSQSDLTLDDVCDNGAITDQSIQVAGLISTSVMSQNNNDVLDVSSIGSENQIPFSNADGNDFNYSSNLIWDGSIFDLGGNFQLTGYAQGSNFSLTTDFNGQEWKATNDGYFNMRKLIVRESAIFRELIINQLSAIGGSQILSAARGKIKSVSSNTVTLEDPNEKGVSQFQGDVDGDGTSTDGADIFVVRTVDIDSNQIKYVTGWVKQHNNPGAGNGNPTITLTQDSADISNTSEANSNTSGSISDLSEGDVIMSRGNVNDTTRQNAIYWTATDTDSPVSKYFTDLDRIDAFDDQDNIKVTLGNLSNMNDAAFGDFSGKYGLYSRDVYLKGKMAVAEPLDTSVRVELDPSKNTPASGTILDGDGQTETTSTDSDKTEYISIPFASGQPEAYQNFAVKVTITGYSLTPRYNAKVYIEAYSDSQAAWTTLEDTLLWIGSKGGDFTGYTIAYIDPDYSDFRIKIVHKYGNTSGTVAFDWQVYEGTVLINDSGIYIRTSDWTYKKIGASQSSVGYVDEGAGGDEAVEWDDIENNPFKTNSASIGDGTANDISFIFNDDGINRILEWQDGNARFNFSEPLAEQGSRVATRVWSTLQNVTTQGNITDQDIYIQKTIPRIYLHSADGTSNGYNI